MAEVRKSETADESLRSQVEFLKRAVILLLIACLGVSVCLNVYIVGINSSLRGNIAGIEERLARQAELERFVDRIVMDLRQISRTDKAVQALLKKHGVPLPPAANAAPEQ